MNVRYKSQDLEWFANHSYKVELLEKNQDVTHRIVPSCMEENLPPSNVRLYQWGDEWQDMSASARRALTGQRRREMIDRRTFPPDVIAALPHSDIISVHIDEYSGTVRQNLSDYFSSLGQHLAPL